MTHALHQPSMPHSMLLVLPLAWSYEGERVRN